MLKIFLIFCSFKNATKYDWNQTIINTSLIDYLTSLESCFKVKIMNFARGKRPSTASEKLSMWCLLKSIKRRRSLILKSNWFLKYGFCNKSFRKDEPLTIWTLFFTYLFVIKLDSPLIKTLERIRFSSNQSIGEEEFNFDDKYICWKKCSTGQMFIFPKWLVTKSIL